MFLFSTCGFFLHLHSLPFIIYLASAMHWSVESYLRFLSRLCLSSFPVFALIFLWLYNSLSILDSLSAFFFIFFCHPPSWVFSSSCSFIIFGFVYQVVTLSPFVISVHPLSCLFILSSTIVLADFV